MDGVKIQPLLPNKWLMIEMLGVATEPSPESLL